MKSESSVIFVINLLYASSEPIFVRHRTLSSISLSQCLLECYFIVYSWITWRNFAFVFYSLVGEIVEACTLHIKAETPHREYFFTIPTNAHTIYTLKSTKIHIKTLKILPLHVSISFLRPSSGDSWTLLCQVTKLKSVDIRSLYRVVRFAAVCHYIPSLYVSVVPYWVKPYHGVVETHTQTDCNDIRPQTAHFYNERISTDLNLVTWQITVHEPPEDGLKNGTETCRGMF
jgi:hypothetical protein